MDFNEKQIKVFYSHDGTKVTKINSVKWTFKVAEHGGVLNHSTRVNVLDSILAALTVWSLETADQ